MSKRIARTFTTFADTVVAPQPHLPPVQQTDAAEFFATWLRLAPKANAVALKAAVIGLEVGPLTLGYRRPLTKLNANQKARYIQQLEKHKAPQIRQATKALKGIAFLCYYGDDGLLKRLGYDADANLGRARALRVGEGRP